MKSAADIIQKLRENTDTLSYFMLAHLYEMGELLPRDLDKAAEFYNKAASNKVPLSDRVATKYKIMAHYNSLILQANGHGTDDAADLVWLAEAELHGDAEILYRLGTLFEWGIIFAKNGDMALKLYSLAYKHKHPDATCRLAGLYGNGIGCTEDENKSQALFKEAKNLGSPTAKFLVDGREYVTIWPNEEWLTRDEVGNYGSVFGNTSGFKMLSSVVKAQQKTLDTNKSFCIAQQITNPADYNVMFWLQKLSFWDVPFATCTAANYALDRLNTFAKEKETYLSGSAFMMPAIFGDSSVIESYVKLYVWTQAWLSRAKMAGANVSNELKVLEKHKDKVEVSCQNIYGKYKALADKDDEVWKQSIRFIKADADNRIKNRPVVMVPGNNIKTCLEHVINNSNLEEYNLWQQCIFDEAQLNTMHRKFFNQAVKTKRFDIARKFANEIEFDINYIIDGIGMSPLEFIIEQGFISEAEMIIQRADVDVNFNFTIFRAAMNGNPDIMQALLKRHDLKLDVNCQINNVTLTPVEVAKKYNNDVAAQILSDHIKAVNNSSRKEKSRSEIVSDLYFQYRYESETTNSNTANVHSNASSNPYSYKYKG